jgi:hypothetical protein
VTEEGLSAVVKLTARVSIVECVPSYKIFQVEKNHRQFSITGFSLNSTKLAG